MAALDTCRFPGCERNTRELLTVLSDPEQLEAELAAVRADAQAEVSSAAPSSKRPRAASDSKPMRPPRQR
jgi:hypothetical protein